MGSPNRFDREVDGISRFSGFLEELGAQQFTLTWGSGIPAETDLMIIPGPLVDLSPDQVARLWLYMNNGGHVMLVADALDIRRREVAGASRSLGATRGLFELVYPDFGMRAQNDVVMLAESVDGGEQFSLAGETVNINAEHPITSGLTGPLYFSDARSLGLDVNTANIVLTPLVFTSSAYYGETGYTAFIQDGTPLELTTDDTPRGELPLVASMENGETGARLVMIGDIDMLQNGGGFQSLPSYSANFVYPDNIRLAVNAVMWLLDTEPAALTLATP